MLYSPSQILCLGLDLLGIEEKRRLRCRRSMLMAWFKSHYGSSALVLCAVWEDLVTTDLPDARIDPTKARLDYFLMANYYLRLYPTEMVFGVTFNKTEKTVRLWAWYFCSKIAALKDLKIFWPEEWEHENIDDETVETFLFSVDGVHFRAYEPKHPTLAKNTKAFSYKSQQAGFTYEIALAVFRQNVVSFNGPYLASQHDMTTFKKDLSLKLPAGKRSIADNGYRGAAHQVSLPNSWDCDELRRFKGRARARQESFNARMKIFNSLSHNFRHGMAKHQVCFEAVLVLCQYQIETDSPLFDV